MKNSALRLLWLSVSLVSFLLVTTQPVSAKTLTRNIETTVEIGDSAEAVVTQKQKITWDNATTFFPAAKNFVYVYIYPAYENQSGTLDAQVTDIQVRGGSSARQTILFKKTVENGSIQLEIPYYENLDSGTPLYFTVSYRTSLYTTEEGGILDVVYPGLAADYPFQRKNSEGGYEEKVTYSLKFLSTHSRGTPVYVSPSEGVVRAERSKNSVTFSGEQVRGRSVRLSFGTSRMISFRITGNTVATNSSTPAFVQGLLNNYVEIALPHQLEGTEFRNQTVYYSRLDPFPISLRTDEDGNLLAKFPVSATNKGSITIEGYAVLKAEEIPSALLQATVPTDDARLMRYLGGEEQYWQIDAAEITALSRQTIAPSDTLHAAIRKTMSVVSQKLEYNTSVSAGTLTRLGAVRALQEGKGVCMEYSDLALSVLRASGIPSRVVYGDGVGIRAALTIPGVGHQWNSVWFPEYGWLPFDPTWSDGSNEYIGHDTYHLTWYVASQSVDEPSGFNCLSWDSQSPCQEPLQIHTEAVSELPSSGLLTQEALQEQVKAQEEDAATAGFSKRISSGLTNFANTQVGRIVLSTQSLLILFALVLYGVLVGLVRVVLALIRKKAE